MAATAPSNGAALDLSKSPQEMLKIFRETQQNMIELNKSRLAALEEVKALRARVSLLGRDTPILHACMSLSHFTAHFLLSI